MKESEFNDYNNDPIFDQLEELEPIDEYTNELMRWSSELERKYERRFEAAGIDEESLKEVGAELAAELREKSLECPYVHSSVFVTGDISKGYYNEQSNTIETHEETYQRKQVTMRGFSADIKEDESGGRRITIGYEFETGEVASFTGVDSVYFATQYEMLAFAPIGHIEVDDGIDNEARYEALRRDYPEVMRAIDMCLSGQPDLNESLRRLSLCRFEADAHMLASDRSAIGEYVYKRLDIEDGMLHSMIAEGIFNLGERPDGRTEGVVINGSAPVIARPQAVSLGNELLLGSHGETTISSDWVLHLSLRLLNGDRYAPDQSMAIPMTGIKDFYSIRDACTLHGVPENE